MDEKKDYWQVRENCAYKIVSDISLIKISGADAATYLQTQTSNDLLSLAEGKGLFNSLLDRKAHLRAFFSVHLLEGSFYLLTEKNQTENLQEHLENFHFTEDFEMNEITEKYSFVLIQGPFSKKNLSKIWENDLFQKMKENDIGRIDDMLFINKRESGENGFLIITPIAKINELIKKMQEMGIETISAEVAELLRIEAGLPKYGKDMDETNLLPETGLEKISVSYTKGCYLGQEVVARIKTYGIIPQALIGLEFNSEEFPPSESEISFAGKNIGIIKSIGFSPLFGKPLALAYIKRDFRQPDEKKEFLINGKIYSVFLRLLPFYRTEKDATKYYEKALDLFAENKEKEAIDLLKIALAKNEENKDIYETLGVILSRNGKHQEAIEVMKQLTEIDPEADMAYTNLSIFEMRLGNKEEAEKYQAKANELKFKKNVAESMQKKMLAEKQKQEIEAIKERMEMFKEVLETEDSEDLIANYGMGKSLFDLKKPEEAIPYLEKATKIKKDYSMAFLLLGKALEESGETTKALNIYKEGIIVASQKGDLLPLKEMEMKRNNLEGRKKE